MFDTKGCNYLRPGSDLDYLSMRISTNEAGDIMLDNQLKIEKYLNDMGLTECNPTQEPIHKDWVKKIHDEQVKEMLVDDAQVKEFQRILGDAQWLAQTTHPTLAVACSIYASMGKKVVPSSLAALKHMLR